MMSKLDYLISTSLPARNIFCRTSGPQAWLSVFDRDVATSQWRFLAEWLYSNWVLFTSQPHLTSRGGIYHESWKVSPITSVNWISGSPTEGTNSHCLSQCLLSIQTEQALLTLLQYNSAWWFQWTISIIFLLRISHFTFCLNNFGLQHHINFPIHSKGHILDMVCFLNVTPLNCFAADFTISNQMLI